MYLYTDEIDFAPFGSKVNRELRIPELVSEEAGAIPRPSPKSIYRIADMVRVNNHGGDCRLIPPVRQYDLPKLKDLAFESIRGGVKSCDAVEETFSKFTSRLVCITSLRIIGLSTDGKNQISGGNEPSRGKSGVGVALIGFARNSRTA